eukprot:NODE_13578_length_1158_cov_3.414161.p1 GENE.NODE_13578_length_1158_cov_3.414161~~NODE_13578_length_1158_cov_3.414161.p1  ORF type:complete len:300 (-),score=31.88 NODE_13578_length_1158_cov_3.414161:203-1102(-)
MLGVPPCELWPWDRCRAGTVGVRPLLSGTVGCPTPQSPQPQGAQPSLVSFFTEAALALQPLEVPADNTSPKTRVMPGASSISPCDESLQGVGQQPSSPLQSTAPGVPQSCEARSLSASHSLRSLDVSPPRAAVERVCGMMQPGRPCVPPPPPPPPAILLPAPLPGPRLPILCAQVEQVGMLQRGSLNPRLNIVPSLLATRATIPAQHMPRGGSAHVAAASRGGGSANVAPANSGMQAFEFSVQPMVGMMSPSKGGQHSLPLPPPVGPVVLGARSTSSALPNNCARSATVPRPKLAWRHA